MCSVFSDLLGVEDGVSETDADASFLHENWNKDLKLFSTSKDATQKLFCNLNVDLYLSYLY